MSTSASMAFNYIDDPNVPFDASVMRISGEVVVKWKTTDNVQKTCNAEGARFGLVKNYRENIRACAYWRKNWCLIITGKTTTLHSVGHEIRHCFQGDWHDQNN